MKTILVKIEKLRDVASHITQFCELLDEWGIPVERISVIEKLIRTEHCLIRFIPKSLGEDAYLGMIADATVGFSNKEAEPLLYTNQGVILHSPHELKNYILREESKGKE